MEPPGFRQALTTRWAASLTAKAEVVSLATPGVAIKSMTHLPLALVEVSEFGLCKMTAANARIAAPIQVCTILASFKLTATVAIGKNDVGPTTYTTLSNSDRLRVGADLFQSVETSVSIQVDAVIGVALNFVGMEDFR